MDMYSLMLFRFQTLIGRIETHHVFKCCEHRNEFQTLIGRIETLKMLPPCLVYLLFQTLIGRIETQDIECF